MPLNVGTRLGHYDVTALIGQGGMGEVYRAADTDGDVDLIRAEAGARAEGHDAPGYLRKML